MPLISLYTYRSVYENNRLFRKPPLLGHHLCPCPALESKHVEHVEADGF